MNEPTMETLARRLDQVERENRRLKQAGVVALAVIVAVGLAGCGTVPIAPTFEERPLFRPLEARVGVAYTGAARTAMAVTPLMRFEIGKTSVARFEQVFAAMFAASVALPDWPPWREGVKGLDGVIELERVDTTVTLGNDRDTPDVIQVAYRVCLYDAKVAPVACWTPSVRHSYQRKPFTCLDLSACLQPEVEVAMREAIARFMLEFERDPAVLTWARQLTPETPRVGLLMWPTALDAPVHAFVSEIEECLTQNIAAMAPEIALVPQRSVRDMLFPLMEPATQPADVAAFATLLSRDDVLERLAGRGLDYLVAFAGSTKADPWSGFMNCGSGCLGFMWQSETTQLQAALWTMDTGKLLGGGSVTITGTSIMPAFVLPIPLLAHTQSDACRDLAAEIVAAVRGAGKR